MLNIKTDLPLLWDAAIEMHTDSGAPYPGSRGDNGYWLDEPLVPPPVDKWFTMAEGMLIVVRTEGAYEEWLTGEETQQLIFAARYGVPGMWLHDFLNDCFDGQYTHYFVKTAK